MTTPRTPMLTVDLAALPPGKSPRLHALEFDLEHGHVQAFGRIDVTYAKDGRGRPYVESGETGGCYTDPDVVDGVQVWAAEDHRLAVFPDAPSMCEGARRLAAAWGDALPAGIARVIT